MWNQKEAYTTVVTTVPAIFLTLVEGDNYASPLVGRNLAGSPDVIKDCGKFPQHSVSDNVSPQAFINSAGMLQTPTALPDFNLETAAGYKLET